jgi:hypothetical protein
MTLPSVVSPWRGGVIYGELFDFAGEQEFQMLDNRRFSVGSLYRAHHSTFSSAHHITTGVKHRNRKTIYCAPA